MSNHCDAAGGCLCRCRDSKTKQGCASGNHCNVHGRKCHMSCKQQRIPPGTKPPRKSRADGAGWGGGT